MSEEAQEKEYQPSLHRLDELKKKGTFLRSRDMGSGAVLILSIVTLIVLADNFYQVLAHNFTAAFTHFDHLDSLATLYYTMAVNSFLLLLPLLLCLFVFSFLLAFVFGGFGLSTDLIKFKLERIDPLKNIKKIVSFSNLIEIIKSVFKFSLFFFLQYLFLYGRSDELLHLGDIGNSRMPFIGMELIKSYLLFIIAGIVVIMAIDMLYSYVSFQKKIKMSYQELKDEHKEMDGNPENKRRIRQAQLALSRQRIQHDVPGATVIITNPTHYAVALKYDAKKDKAPRVIACGVDNIAADIRLIAIKHVIPIYEAPVLARAIYHTGKPGMYIHPELYMAVAMVLSYINQLKSWQAGVGELPVPVSDFQIPDEFYFDS